MTREQIISTFADNGLEAPNKGVVTQMLNAFNQEKAQEIFNAKEKAFDEAEAKYKDFVKPEDHQKVVDELTAEKGKGALVERKAKYKEANLNIDDEDVLTLVESKLKDSKDFDKDLAEYVKAHPSFVKSGNNDDKGKGKEEPKQPNPTKTITIGGAGSNPSGSDNAKANTLAGAISQHYEENK